MPQTTNHYVLRSQSGEIPELKIAEDSLHEIFSFVERRKIQEPMDVYRGTTRLARIHLADNGMWEIDWHPEVRD